MEVKPMNTPTIFYQDGLVVLDQSKLPLIKEYLRLNDVQSVYEAILSLKVRGAPVIGITAAFGLYIGIKDFPGEDREMLLKQAYQVGDYLKSARPTAVNLAWAVDRMLNKLKESLPLSVQEIKDTLLAEAQKMIDEDNAVCLAIGQYGKKLIKPNSGILTHCNAGGLGTARFGTALAPMYLAHREGIPFKVFVDETRPVLQGARLTAWELKQAGVPFTLICDNMAAMVMAKGWVQAVIVGTDRVAGNGDVANKIGTYGLAVLAHAHNIPFYVAAPRTSIDYKIASGEEIPIEERDPKEITMVSGKDIAPRDIEVYNPAFDVTPHQYITAFITETGLVFPPFRQGLEEIRFKPGPSEKTDLDL
jgi:methylthioribose-1-phosphate isomerase